MLRGRINEAPVQVQAKANLATGLLIGIIAICSVALLGTFGSNFASNMAGIVNLKMAGTTSVPTTCADSDSIIQFTTSSTTPLPLIKGYTYDTISDPSIIPKHPIEANADYCFMVGTSTHPTSCNGTGCGLMERYCTNGRRSSRLYLYNGAAGYSRLQEVCPNGCINGECKPNLCLANPVGHACGATSTASFPNTVLKSDFFKNDPVANSIMDGKDGHLYNYDMREFLLFTAPNSLFSIDNFSYKILSALRMMGYNTIVMNTSPAPGHYYSVEMINKFQLLNSLPLSVYLDKKALAIIDAGIKQKESNYSLGRSFPLYNYFVDVPETEVPKEHYLSIMALALKSLPNNLVFSTKQNFSQIQFGIYYDKKKNIFWEPGYYHTFNHQIDFSDLKCELYSADGLKIYNISDSDYANVATFLHEYGHFIDGGSGLIPPNSTSHFINTGGFKSISWTGYYTKIVRNNGSSYLNYEFVSDYSSTNWQEDFADHFSYYIMNGRLFREAAKYNTYLRQKYNWLKENVFSGIEYDTGGYKQGLSIDNNNFPNSFSITDDINYIWDGKFLLLPKN